MENLVFTQLSIPEVRQLLREELEQFFTDNALAQTPTEIDRIGGIELAIEITGLAKPTIYGLVHQRKIPHSKQNKRLYFSRRELLEWISAGRRKTQAEIATEAADFGGQTKKKVR